MALEGRGAGVCGMTAESYSLGGAEGGEGVILIR